MVKFLSLRSNLTNSSILGTWGGYPFESLSLRRNIAASNELSAFRLIPQRWQ